MKVIDLLNKIANNEEVPKKVIYYGIEYIYDESDSTYYDDKDMTLLESYNFNILNDEIEVLEKKKTLNNIRESYGLPRIEEKKIPEKLSTWFSLEMSQSKELNREYANTNFENTYEKINEIIDYLDYLKSKGDE